MKGVKLANTARTEGNNYYRSRDFDKALDSYNKSVRCSSFLTDSYIKALGNKSALQFEKGRYADCQDIISFIFSLRRLDLDEGFVEKLDSRVKSCSEKLNSTKHSSTKPKRPSEVSVNPNLCVVNTDHGRSVVTTSNMAPNETVYHLAPYSCVLAPDKWTSYCYHCFRYIRDTVIVPCDNCAAVQYCCSRCRDENVIHGTLECPRIDQFADFGIFHLSVRVLVKLKPASVKSLFDAIEEETGDRKEIGNNIEDVGDREVILLHYNDQIRAEVFENTLPLLDQAVGIIQLSQRFSVVKPATIRTLLETIACQMILNASTITHFLPSSQIVPVGSGIYPTLALLNHSCYPNTTCLFTGNIVTVKALRHIPSAATVFNTYGVDFEHHARDERQKILNSQYGFECKCDCCVDEWSGDNTIRYVKCNKCEEDITIELNSAGTCSSCATSLSGMLEELEACEGIYTAAFSSFKSDVKCCFEMLTGAEYERLQRVVRLPDSLCVDWNDLVKKCILSAHQKGQELSTSYRDK